MSFSRTFSDLQPNEYGNCILDQLVSFFIIFFQLPELKAQHDKAIMRAYFSKDLDIAELKSSAQKEWEERDHEAEPDLALLTQADIHGNRSEQSLGRDTLVTTQGDLLKMTGETTLSEESRQLLLLSVSSFCP